MKLLLVIDCFCRRGGAEKLVMDLALEFKSRGVFVEILSIVTPPSYNMDFAECANSNGIKTHYLSKGNIYNPLIIFKLRQFLLKNVYDIIHVHLFPALYYVAIACDTKNCLVYTEHSTDNRRRHTWYGRILDRWIYRKYSKVVTISEQANSNLIDHLGYCNTIIINNGIRVQNFYNAQKIDKYELTGTDVINLKIITMCARFVDGKDYMTLIKSIKLLPLYVHLVCVGDGPNRLECEKFCESIEIKDRVHFLGIRKDVDRIFKSSDLIVLSTAYEGFSISMLEAMASGTPFIASDVVGVRDLVSEYVPLFPYKDYEALAEMIKDVINNNHFRETIILKCLSFASKFDISIIANKYLMLYDSTINEKKTFHRRQR